MSNYKKFNINGYIEKMDSESKFLYEVEEDHYKLIENLVKQRKIRNMTQEDISNITGMSQQAISRIEKYGHTPSLTNLLKYMRALNLDINRIFA